MLVVDNEGSEHGLQRRKTATGRVLHCCCICSKVDTWSPNWQWYGSVREEDGGEPVAKFCSRACVEKAGPNAINVTNEMKRKAKDAEWRDPTIAYREATDREKYSQAAWDQHQSKEAGPR